MPGQEAEQGRARWLGEPPGVPDQVLVRQVGVAGGDRHAGEVVDLGQRVLDVRDRQHQGQRGGFRSGQRPDGLVAVQQEGGRGEIGGGRAALVQAWPADHGAFQGQGQVVHGRGAVGQPEVEDPGYSRVRRGRGPGEVGRVPVTVPPLRGQRRERRSGVRDQRAHDGVEMILPAPSGQVGSQRRPPAHQRACLLERVGRGDDLAGIHQHRGRPGLRAEIRRGQVQAAQGGAGRIGVPEARVRRPGGRLAVHVDPVRDLVDLVAVLTAAQHRLAVGQPEHGRDRQAPLPQVPGEGVLRGELAGGADAEVVALDEDGRVAVPDQRGGRHRPRAAPGHDRLAAQAARVAAAQDAAELIVRQRQPVELAQLTAPGAGASVDRAPWA